MVFIKQFDVPQRDVKIKTFVTFFVSSGMFKDEEFSFQPVDALNIELLKTCFGRVFAYFQETPTLPTLVSCC